VASHKILVIDDSRVIRNMVRDMLPKGNFQVLEAKDGVEGLDCIRQERPNLIMLDFLLPRMSGWEVFQQIQSQPDLQTIPLVLMSGRREEVTESGNGESTAAKSESGGTCNGGTCGGRRCGCSDSEGGEDAGRN
jgi:CheY-like chemotaxis protein